MNCQLGRFNDLRNHVDHLSASREGPRFELRRLSKDATMPRVIQVQRRITLGRDAWQK